MRRRKSRTKSIIINHHFSESHYLNIDSSQLDKNNIVFKKLLPKWTNINNRRAIHNGEVLHPKMHEPNAITHEYTVQTKIFELFHRMKFKLTISKVAYHLFIQWLCWWFTPRWHFAYSFPISMLESEPNTFSSFWMCRLFDNAKIKLIFYVLWSRFNEKLICGNDVQREV